MPLRALFLAFLGWGVLAAASSPSPIPQESKAYWRFREATLGSWARADLVSALDTASSRQGIESFARKVHFVHMGPFARCPYEVDLQPGMLCVEIGAKESDENPDPYLVRWDSATGKGVLLHEAWELVPRPHSKSMTERHVGPDSVGWLRPGTLDGSPYLDLMFRKDSVRMVPGESFEQLVNQRFLSGSWTPVGADSSKPYAIFPDGRLGNFRLSEFFEMTPEQQADTTNYNGYKYELRSDRRHGDQMVVKNVWYTPLCTLSWKRRHDTLRLGLFHKPTKRPKSVAWCAFVRKGDAPAIAGQVQDSLLERQHFDTLRQAAFLPADIALDTVIRCLLGLEAVRLATTKSETPAQARAGLAACLASDTGKTPLASSPVDSGGVLTIRSRDGSWSMELSWFNQVALSTRYRLQGPPLFPWMDWNRRDAAFRKAFRFLEPIEGARWIPMHEGSFYAFNARNPSCYLNGKFEDEGITLANRCTGAPEPLPPRELRKKGLRK